MKVFSEVLKVFDVESFRAGDDEEFCFRLEISQELNSDVYIGKVYRLDTYRLQPTFPQSDGIIPDSKHDAQVYVIDDMFDSDKLKGRDINQVVEKFKQELKLIFKNTEN